MRGMEFQVCKMIKLWRSDTQRGEYANMTELHSKLVTTINIYINR